MPRRSSTGCGSGFREIVGPTKDDICYATQNRQEAVRDPGPEADVVLVVGSQNSSNSQRLAELAPSGGVTAASDRRPGRHRPGDGSAGDETVVITAGASAPEDVVQQCVALLQERFQASVESRNDLPGARAFPAAEITAWRELRE